MTKEKVYTAYSCPLESLDFGLINEVCFCFRDNNGSTSFILKKVILATNETLKC